MINRHICPTKGIQMRDVDVSRVFLVIAVILVFVVFQNNVVFSEDASRVNSQIIGNEYEIGGSVFKAIQTSFVDFKEILKQHKKYQSGATTKLPSDISDYRIVVRQDQNNYYIHYFVLDENFLGGHAEYTVSKKTFTITSKRCGK
jgi:hypothetical protein